MKPWQITAWLYLKALFLNDILNDCNIVKKQDTASTCGVLFFHFFIFQMATQMPMEINLNAIASNIGAGVSGA